MPEPSPKRKRGRPETRVMSIDATPERIAQAMFAAVEPPDPSKRLGTVDVREREDPKAGGDV